MSCRCWNPARPNPWRDGHRLHDAACPIGKATMAEVKRLIAAERRKFHR